VSKSHMSGNLASTGEKLGKLKWLCTRIEITSRTKIEQEQRTDQKINLRDKFGRDQNSDSVHCSWRRSGLNPMSEERAARSKSAQLTTTCLDEQSRRA
jgi:hypothetical protein